MAYAGGATPVNQFYTESSTTVKNKAGSATAAGPIIYLKGVTINPSATYTPTTDGTVLCDDGQRSRPPGEFRKRMFMSGSAFPYITTIGLYNDEGQLLVTGKCAQPIQKRSDIDMNFIVRWDY